MIDQEKERLNVEEWNLILR